LDAEEFQMLALNLEKQLELGAQHAWTLAAARDGTSYEQRVMQHLNEEFEMPTPPFERNPAEALVMDWARKKAVDLLESHGYFTLRHDAVFRPFIQAAQNMGLDVVTSEHNPEAVAPLMAQASVFAMDRSVGCKMPLPGKQRLQEVIVTEALQLLATEFSPDLVDAASAALHRFRGTLLPVVPKAQEKTAVVTKPVTPKAGAKKVLFLISDTGGGHRASANAVKDAIGELAGAENFDFQIRDIWTDVSGCFPENKIVDMYKLACGSKFGQMLWGAFYYGSPLIEQPWEAKTRLVCGKRFREFFEQEAPDLVVSMHPLTQNLPLRVLDTMARKPGPDGEVKPKIPFATVCTDLGSAHSGWFHNEADVCFVASETLEKKAKRRGLAPEKIRNYGLPVRKQFWSSSKRTTATPPARNYTALGLRPGLKTVLVMGGGEGSGGLDKIVKNIARELDRTQPGECQVVAICGKNEKVVEKLKAQKYPDGVSVAVRGFTSAMSEYMDVADVLVTKAGPGTIAEAAIRGLPTMLSSHLYGQEWGNVPFVVDAGWGEYSTNPRKLAGKVSAVLKDDDLRAEMRAKAQASATPDATKQIAADLLSLLDSAEAEKAASPSPIEALGNFAKRLVPGQGD
jgi:1,2-diacylglycerol 3-beta-galactosyltransferase